MVDEKDLACVVLMTDAAITAVTYLSYGLTGMYQ